MNKLSGKKEVNALTFLFSVTYMVSYITRINYGAVISEMESATAFSRSELSMAVTGSFITYGLGQIVSGIVGDRLSPKRLVSLGLSVTVSINFMIPLCHAPYQMLAAWCINGFAQSFMWPPLVRLMATLLSEDDYKTTTAKVSWGSSIGTVVVYLISPVLISAFGWRSVFLFSALCGVIMLIVWNIRSYDVMSEKKPAAAVDAKTRSGSLFSPLMIFVMLAIILQGMLRDGVTTWMPSYISETYRLSSVISILTGVVLPVFSIICFRIATALYINKLTNPIACAGVFFASGTLAALGLFFVSGQNAVFSVLFSALLTGCMHGVNLMLICMIPPFFKESGKVSTVSGILNSCTYIGSALSTYGIALLSERFSWKSTLFIWLLTAAAGTLICLLCIRPWASEFEN